MPYLKLSNIIISIIKQLVAEYPTSGIISETNIREGLYRKPVLSLSKYAGGRNARHPTFIESRDWPSLLMP